MIYGLPWTSWLLLFVAVGLGLGISLAFYRVHRGELPGRTAARVGADVEDSPSPGAESD